MLEQLLAEKIGKLEVENAQYKVAYHHVTEENSELKKLKEIVESNSDLKDLIEEIKNKGEQK